MKLKDMPVHSTANVVTDYFYSGDKVTKVERLGEASWACYTDRGSFSYLPGQLAYQTSMYLKVVHSDFGYLDVELIWAKPTYKDCMGIAKEAAKRFDKEQDAVYIRRVAQAIYETTLKHLKDGNQ